MGRCGEGEVVFGLRGLGTESDVEAEGRLLHHVIEIRSNTFTTIDQTSSDRRELSDT